MHHHRGSPGIRRLVCLEEDETVNLKLLIPLAIGVIAVMFLLAGAQGKAPMQAMMPE